MKLLETITQTLVSFIPGLLIGFLPLAVFIWRLWLHKKQYHENASLPFTDLPRRPPGETLRIQLKECEDEYDLQTSNLLLASAISATVICMLGHQGKWLSVAIISCILSVYYTLNFRSVARQLERIRAVRLGFEGERVVGEHLNQLLANGFKVFHDIPFSGYNIDHVIVSPSGVFSVETKARRKPTDIPSDERARVQVRGDALDFPKGRNHQYIAQAKRNAQSLSRWLTKATGESVHAEAILTLPGWFVSGEDSGDILVLNPTRIQSYVSRKTNVLTPAQIQRIAHQLAEQCRLEIDSSAKPVNSKFTYPDKGKTNSLFKSRRQTSMSKTARS
ncbi:MAG TPA: nuclease-related domain-containing protein [Opitutaceae bacterium]|nr:nuclease-related domain-containing protein [Opitutaceae bacterium]